VFTITQDGLGAALDVYSADFETDGGAGSFTVLADAQTSWKVRSNVDWISVAVEGTGNGEQGTVPLKSEIAFPDFDKVDLRIGVVESCEIVPKSSKLLKFVLDAGALGKRTIFSGIRQAYPEPEKLVGREVVFVANLAPRKMSVGVSEGMILFAGEPGVCGGVVAPAEKAGGGTAVT
jgi:methionyl-tRNA synthetase